MTDEQCHSIVIALSEMTSEIRELRRLLSNLTEAVLEVGTQLQVSTLNAQLHPVQLKEKKR